MARSRIGISNAYVGFGQSCTGVQRLACAVSGDAGVTIRTPRCMTVLFVPVGLIVMDHSFLTKVQNDRLTDSSLQPLLLRDLFSSVLRSFVFARRVFRRAAMHAFCKP